MESVTIRFEKPVLKNVDKAIKANNFNSRTEFIREAVRDKLKELGRDELMKRFMALSGTFPKTAEKERKEAKKEVSRMILKELEEETR